MRRFREAGVRPQTKLGQNFLIDLNLLRVLLDAAELDRHDVVLEVGTGTASLTVHLAERAGDVVTVEIDRQLYQLASEELIDHSNVAMLAMDALEGKNRLNPEVVAAVEQRVAAEPGRRFKLVANLPYQIATPLVMNLLLLDRPPAAMIVTIQKELADRIVAQPGSRDYGALSIWVQSQCRVELVRTLPPSVFWPRPKVTSAILRITLDPSLRDRIADRKFFHAFVRSMFMHRRKLLRFELCSVLADRLDKPGVDRLMGDMGFGVESRAEQLGIDAMLALAEQVRGISKRILSD
jgi:16S rRNA (adenine1518-N6/adenine1519-N6)-dimethyltransferase